MRETFYKSNCKWEKLFTKATANERNFLQIWLQMRKPLQKQLQMRETFYRGNWKWKKLFTEATACERNLVQPFIKQLTTSFKEAEGLALAMPSEQFLTPVSKSPHNIKATIQPPNNPQCKAGLNSVETHSLCLSSSSITTTLRVQSARWMWPSSPVPPCCCWVRCVDGLLLATLFLLLSAEASISSVYVQPSDLQDRSCRLVMVPASFCWTWGHWVGFISCV